jgi:hypothetical protein
VTEQAEFDVTEIAERMDSIIGALHLHLSVEGIDPTSLAGMKGWTRSMLAMGLIWTDWLNRMPDRSARKGTEDALAFFAATILPSKQANSPGAQGVQ